MIWDQSLWELFNRGSFVMWPLLACSIVGLAVLVERAVFFSRMRFRYDRFLAQLKLKCMESDVQTIAQWCQKQRHPVPQVVIQYLKYLDKGAQREEALQRVCAYAMEKVEARLRVLASITHMAPLLGLLGTVTGLVTAFHQIESLGGQVQPADLASGIWAALLTTVFGLLVALPCMAAYHAFESQADKISRQMQLIVLELNEVFKKHEKNAIKEEQDPFRDWKMTVSA